ncbi:hypothetical protein PGTUg99_009558 [Puccinia graminis f. sp. tritici]|uniref:Uncharacterized protein n=1 Tax=Puccinia graminis f. sp. tritici TaxID=56615 RepID=A0A5B0RZP0_PUCGR|nr:hypothetical protein PGTUg99_009558 [Puccinia graminis f. sp. tritici]
MLDDEGAGLYVSAQIDKRPECCTTQFARPIFKLIYDQEVAQFGGIKWLDASSYVSHRSLSESTRRVALRWSVFGLLMEVRPATRLDGPKMDSLKTQDATEVECPVTLTEGFGSLEVLGDASPRSRGTTYHPPTQTVQLGGSQRNKQSRPPTTEAYRLVQAFLVEFRLIVVLARQPRQPSTNGGLWHVLYPKAALLSVAFENVYHPGFVESFFCSGAGGDVGTVFWFSLREAPAVEALCATVGQAPPSPNYSAPGISSHPVFSGHGNPPRRNSWLGASRPGWTGSVFLERTGSIED